MASRSTARVRPRPRFQRAARPDALRLARHHFLDGERVDMQALATELSIGRTTLYRWVGEREQLIGEVLGTLCVTAWKTVERDATGDGLDRAIDTIRRFMQITADFDPLRSFAQREPETALRVLLAPQGAVAAQLREGFARAVRAHAGWLDPTPETINLMAHVATAMQWASIASHQDPDIPGAVTVMRSLLSSAANRPDQPS